MPKPRRSTIKRFVARVVALLPEDWSGNAGAAFRDTTKNLSNYVAENIRPFERLNELPDLGWSALEGGAHEKRAKALSDYQQAEKTRIEAEIARRTAESKLRQEVAKA